MASYRAIAAAITPPRLDSRPLSALRFGARLDIELTTAIENPMQDGFSIYCFASRAMALYATSPCAGRRRPALRRRLPLASTTDHAVGAGRGAQHRISGG